MARSLLKVTSVKLAYPMGPNRKSRPGEGYVSDRMMRPWESVMMVRPYIEPGMPLLYPRWWDDGEEKLDHNYMLFNRPGQHSEKIGVVVETLKGTAIVACKYFVRYNSFARVVARTQRCWSHDEDNACVVGDVVMIKTAPRRGKFKAHLVQSILEPDLEARERLKKGLAERNPPKMENNISGWKPIFDFSRDNEVNEEERARAQQLADDITATDADYDDKLAKRIGKDKWAFLDDEISRDYGDLEEEHETEFNVEDDNSQPEASEDPTGEDA